MFRHLLSGKTLRQLFKLKVVASMLLLSSGCGTHTTAAPAATVRQYHGAASVGDFLSITIDATAATIAYTNLSNGDTGTVPYTINPDGTYALNDPGGNLITAYEVPDYALIIQAAKTGPNHDTPALITAVNQSPISLATWQGKTYNTMQFRTAAGGLEVGSVTIDPQGNIANNSYWPYGAISNQNAFHAGGFPGSALQADPSGSFLKLTEGGSTDYIFGTASGVFAVDTPNGAILGLQQASSKDFDASFAGTYKAVFYQKTGASTGQGNVENGTPSLGTATIAITSSGEITVQDAQGNNVIQTALTPVADTAYLQGAGKLTNPCNGLFTFRVTTSSKQQDVFVAFQNNSLLFASFSTALPLQTGNPYDYLYGVGIR